MSSKGFTYKFKIDAEINDLIAKTNQIKQSLETVMKAGKAPGAAQIFSSVEKALDRLQQKTSQPITSAAMFDSIQKDTIAAAQQLSKLEEIFASLASLSANEKIELLPPETKQKVIEAFKALETFSNGVAEAKKETEAYTTAQANLAKATKNLNSLQGDKSKAEKLLAIQAESLQTAKDEKAAIDAKVAALKKLQAAQVAVAKGEEGVNIAGAQKEATEVGINIDTSDAVAVTAELERMTVAAREAGKAVTDANNIWRNYNTALTKTTNAVALAENEIADLKATVKELEKEFQSNSIEGLKKSFEDLRKKADSLGIDLKDIPMEYTEEAAEQLKLKIQELINSGFSQLTESQSTAKIALDETRQGFKDLGDETEATKEKFVESNEAAKQIDGFKARIKQFVGLQGAAMIARRALSDAIQTIKDLDEVMTEMAVVTDAGIGDYWGQLAEHTDRASGLGLAIKDVYKAETLYYQQGLKTNEVIAMSTETLKMARIAGLSAEDATNKMTAALRGFNMELNETSAQRVADVYSELAAITASDVDEISSAMTKTASIAASAGMEFETTAAFLSQIIETTRESAETAGTAMKTVIARFSEVKKLKDEGLLTGSDEEGEVIDVNKIQTALRSVGISMDKFFAGTEGLDSIFLKLAEKWDTLDVKTQRYIATTAAGSRQQSRFIAMMSDYARTQELVTAANTSAGASQEQFEKTMDSLESKINQLKNAWAEFTMGIMDSSFVKFGVDVLTTLLNIINNITAGLGKAGGFMDKFTGALSKIGVIVTIVKLGEAMVNKLFTALSNKAAKLGKAIGEGIVQGTTEGLEKAKQKVEQTENEQKAEQAGAEQKKPSQDGGTGQVQEAMKKQSHGIKGIFQGIATMQQGGAQVQGKDQPGLRQQAFSEVRASTRKNGDQGLDAALGKSGKKMASSFVSEKTWGSIEGQFKNKMKNLGASTEQISAAWDKASKKIAKNKSVHSVLKDLDTELETTADAWDKKLGTKTQDGMKRIGTTVLDVSDEIGDLGDEATMAAEDLEIVTQQTVAGYEQLSTSITNVGMAMTGIGMACGAVGMALDEMGLEEEAEIVNGLGTAITTVGGVMTSLGGIMTFMKPMMATLIAQTYAAAAGNMVEGTSIFAKAAAWLVLQTAMSPVLAITLVLIGALLALVAVVAIVIAIFKAVKNSTPEAKLERTKEASEAAAEAADTAAEAYNHLAESLENLSDKYKTLEELAQGTKEWRDAVREVNSEVLELVEQYPKLAGYIKNEGGVLKLDIESDEVQGVLDEYEKNAVETKSASIAGKIAVLEAQNKVDYEALSDDTELGEQGLSLQKKIVGHTLATMLTAIPTGRVKDAVIDGLSVMDNVRAQESLNEEATNAMAEALAKGLIAQKDTGEWVSTGKESEKQLADLELTMDAVQAFGEELGDNVKYLKEYGEQVQARKEQEEALYEALALNAVQMVDSSKLTEEQLKQVNTAANAEYIQYFENEAKKSILEETKDMDKDGYKDWAKSKAMELYGTDEISVDNDGNVTIGTGDNAKTVDRESFEKQLAAANATEEAAEKLQNLPKAIEAASKKMGGEAGKALSKSYNAAEGKAMTRSDIKALEGQDLQAVWDQLDESQQQAFGDFKLFSEHVQNSIDLSKAAFETAEAGLTEMGATIEFNGKLTSEAAKGYGDQLEHVMANMGQDGVDAVNNALDGLVNTMDEEELAKFMSQINALDWKNMEEWDNLPDTLEQIGLNIPNAELQNFIKVAQESAGAIRNIDLESLNAQMADLQSIVKRVKTGEQGRVFSSQDYESLVEAVPSLAGKFQQTLEGDYVYLGSAMQDLTVAIQDNTAALLKEAQEQLQNKIDAAQLMDRMAKHFGWEGAQANILEWKKWSEDDSASNIRGYLFTFINEAVAGGMDLKQLGIENLSNRTKVENLTDEQIEEILDQLVGIFNDWDDNTRLLMDKTVSALSLTYQNRDATTNSAEASRYRSAVARGESLTEEEETAFKASTNTLTTQALMAGVNSVAINDYSKTVEAMEELYNKYQKKEIGDKEFKTQYAKLQAQIEAFEQEITNQINLNTMNSALQSTMESIGGLGEELDNLTDEASKIEVVAQMVDQFGIKVNESNYEQIAALAQSMAQGGEAGYKAFISLMQMAGEDYGLTLHQLQTMTITEWNDTTNQMPKQMQEFADMMVAAGSAMWVEMDNGGKRFVLATKNHLKSAAENADAAKEMWENPYDALYNLEQRMNVLVRKREKLERAYEKALQDSGVSAQELVDITASQLKALKQEATLQKKIAQQASENISNKIKENSQYKELYQFDKITGRITVDYTKVDSMNFNADEGDDFEEFISYLEEQSDIMKTAQDSFDDIEGSVKEIEQRGRDSVSSIYNQVKEGLIKNYETQLQELENINNSIQEAASAMLSKMQEQIDETRQARDNEKTENEISDKELRLAYLMQDTSGGNATEIAALQKEIAEAKEGYTDTLVDQAIDNLSKENERAAEQRERQIELQREQLEVYANSSEVWNEVKRIVDDGFAQVALGVPFVDTEAGKLAAINEGIDSLNPLEKEDFVTELNVMAKEGAIHEGFVSITGRGNSHTTIADLAGVVDEAIGSLRDEAEKPVLVKAKQNENKDDSGNESGSFWEKVLNQLRGNFAYPHYATGGVADFTGPAWLDGTKTKPEIVLNQTDSANFMQLRDILADILQGTSSLSTSEGKSKGGDNYFDIEINVESITDDYDVEQLADKIRSMIYEDSTYRNVNSITGLR